jgi:hypothetical protein
MITCSKIAAFGGYTWFVTYPVKMGVNLFSLYVNLSQTSIKPDFRWFFDE